MDPITTWTLSISGLGTANTQSSDWQEAGGNCAVVLGGGSSTYNVYNLGGGNVAISDPQYDNYYWNAHQIGLSGDSGNNPTMMLWYWNSDSDNYTSDQIGSDQTFKLVNLGGGEIRLDSEYHSGQSLTGVQGGWYPEQWSYGDGSIGTTPSGQGGQGFSVGGDVLPILIVSNSGYQLDLAGRDLSGLSLAGANMQQCNLQKANLSAVTSLQGADFTSAQLQGADLAGQSLSGATWTQANLSGTDLSTLAASPNAALQGANLSGANLTGLALTGANLQGANLSGADLTNSDLSGADLSGANLQGATLAGTHLQGTNLQGTSFDDCDLSTAQLDPQPDFARATTGRTTFEGATVPFPVISNNWSYLDLTGATITGIPARIAGLVADYALLPLGVDLQKVTLQGASFVQTQLFGAQLQGADLAGANLSQALLEGANLSGANLSMANLQGAYLISQQASEQSGALDDPGKLEAAVLANAFLINTNLTGAYCDGVDFSGSMFIPYSGTGYDSQPATAQSATMNMAKFNEAVLVQAVFDSAQLTGANFAQASLVGASMQSANLSPGSDVNHTDTSLYQADIRGLNGSQSNMDGVDMEGAVYSTASGQFLQIYQDYYGNKVGLAFDFGVTVLGSMTSDTTCPDGSEGPCNLQPAAPAVIPPILAR